jgi:hypothetical protein
VTRCTEERWHGSRARRDRGGAKWGLASPFDVKAMDKGDRGGARGGREEQVARGGVAAGAVGADGGMIGIAAIRGMCARKKWPMGRLSGWAWVGTVESGSAQDQTKISFFNIFTSSSLKIPKVTLLFL